MQPDTVQPGAVRPETRQQVTRGTRSSRRRRKPGRTAGQGGPGRWGSLQGGLGVCIIIGSAAIGTLATMVTGKAPGVVLGLFVVAGTVAAALAVRPSAGWTILPIPVLSYLVAALVSGIIHNRSSGSSKTALAIGAAQWIATGFFAMALATVLAMVLVVIRWFIWRRNRSAAGKPGWSAPPVRNGHRQGGRAVVDELEYQARPGDPASPGQGGRDWGDPGSRGTGPRPGQRPGSGPYNFSSGA